MMKETCVFCNRMIPGKRPTNADRIRGMSDEELAANLMCPNEMGMAELPIENELVATLKAELEGEQCR